MGAAQIVNSRVIKKLHGKEKEKLFLSKSDLCIKI
jgi:hypothetical protein